MKTTRIQRYHQQLLTDGSTTKSEVQSYISTKYVNTDLILFICQTLKCFPKNTDRKIILLNFRKLIIQTPRLPDPEQYRINRDFFDSIRQEQKLNDPLRFIDAELEYLKAIETSTPNDNEWLSEPEMLNRFGFSSITLRRRIAEGMPCAKVGGKKQFSRVLVSDWLAKKANEA